MSPFDWLRLFAQLPWRMRAQSLALEKLALGLQGMSETMAALIESVAERVNAAKHQPALATVTVLCERREHNRTRVGVEQHIEERWVPTVLGGEHWLHDGESYDLRLIPEMRVRNFRWFVSGDPNIVVTAFKVGQETANAAWGGTKYGDAGLTCDVGSGITVRLERRRVPS